VVASDIAGVAVFYLSGCVSKNIPDAFTASVLVDSPFNLIA
jgi:hypothetical protein